MNYKVECIECQQTFESIRSDAKTCGDACRSRYNRRKRREGIPEVSASPVEIRTPEVKSVDPEKVIAGLEKRVQSRYSQLNKAKSAVILKERMIRTKKHEIAEIENEAVRMEKRLRMKDSKILEKFIKPKYEPKQYSGSLLISGLAGFMSQRIERNEQSRRTEIRNFKAACQTRINRLKLDRMDMENAIRELEAGILRAKEFIKVFREEIEKTESRINQLDELRFKQPKPVVQLRTPTQMPVQRPLRKPADSGKPLNGEIGGADLIGMNFETFTLPGELGEFLGELDRNRLAIALTGDSGAGKTTFSYQLARLFLDAGFSTKYFSLEEGVSAIVQRKIASFGLDNRFRITDSGTIKDVRRDAERFDLIIVDSFGKLKAKPEDFDKLRTDFPNTIFIIIFQKTSSGTMRGGPSMLFDSAAAIDIENRDGERVAVMVKSRFGTQGWELDIPTL